MASIQRLKNKRAGQGRFRYRVKYNEEGKQRSRTFADRLDAEQFKINIEKGESVEPSVKRTFGEAADRFLKYGAKDLSDNTRAYYSSLIRVHLKPRFGHRRISKLTMADVEALRDDVEKQLSASTTRGILICLQRVLGYAERHQWVTSNVVRGTAKPGLKPTNRRALLPGEIKALIEATDPRFRMLFKLALATGARQAELLGLEWSAIDKGYIHIRQQYTAGRITQTLKSKTSERFIPIPPEVEKELRRWRMQSPNSELVFPNEKGKPQNASNIRNRAFKPAVLKAKLDRPEEITFHCLRHTYGSTLVNAGRPIAVVSKAMGHSSIAVTCDIYHHASPQSDQDLRDAVAKMELPEAVSL